MTDKQKKKQLKKKEKEKLHNYKKIQSYCKKLKYYNQDVVLISYQNAIYSFYFKNDKQLHHYILGFDLFFSKLKTLPNAMFLKNIEQLNAIINYILVNNNHFLVTSNLRQLVQDDPDDFTLLSPYEEEILQGAYRLSDFNDFYQSCVNPQDFVKLKFNIQSLYALQTTFPANLTINTDQIKYDYQTETIFTFQDSDLNPFNLTAQPKLLLSDELTQLFPSLVLAPRWFYPKHLDDFIRESVNNIDISIYPPISSLEEIQQKNIGELTEDELKCLEKSLQQQYTTDFLASQSFKELQQQVLEKINQTSFSPLQTLCYDKIQNILYATHSYYCEYDDAVLFFTYASTDRDLSKFLHHVMNPLFLNKKIYIWNHNKRGFALLKVVQKYPVNSLWNNNLSAKPIEVYRKDNNQEEIIQILSTKKETMATYGLSTYMLNKLISQQTPNADGLCFRVKVFQPEQFI